MSKKGLKGDAFLIGISLMGISLIGRNLIIIILVGIKRLYLKSQMAGTKKAPIDAFYHFSLSSNIISC